MIHVYFTGSDSSKTVSPTDEERFKGDYEAFLKTGKQSTEPYTFAGRAGNHYIYFPAIAYIVTDVGPQQPAVSIRIA